MTEPDLAMRSRGKKLLAGAVAAPVVLPLIPAIITLVLMFVAVTATPAAAAVFFTGLIATGVAFLIGAFASGILLHKRSRWMVEMREMMAADGIKAAEIDWFRSELKGHERKALKAMEARDVMLADAYRETLASRLTATRVIKTTRRELMQARKRQTSVKQLGSSRAQEFQDQIARDIEKLNGISDKAKNMLGEAESRLQMIEAAASRNQRLVSTDIAMERLSATADELPLALEAAKMTEQIHKELASGKAEVLEQHALREDVAEEEERVANETT